MIVFLIGLAIGEATDLQRQLALRDAVPSCESLRGLYPDLQAELKALVSPDVLPSYVPMRAAGCMLELFPEDVETYREWILAEDKKGLAMLVVSRIEALPLEVAVSLASIGLSGVHSSIVQERLDRVDIPEIRRLLTEEQP